MKKSSFVLSLLTIVLAISSAVGSAFFTTEDAYLFIDEPGVENDECVLFLQDVCSDSGAYACKVDTSSPTLRRQGTETMCGIELRRSTPIP